MEKLKETKIVKFILKYKYSVIIGAIFAFFVSFAPTDYTDDVKQLDIKINETRTNIDTKKEEFMLVAKEEYKVEAEDLKSKLDSLSTEVNNLTQEKTTLQGKLDEQIKKEEEAKKKAEEEKKQQAIAKMRIKDDAVEATKWYYDQSSPQYVNDNGFYIYFGKKENTLPWLRLRISYEDDDWLFIEKYTINVDGKVYNITPPSYSDVQRDNGYGGRVWEWYDKEVTASNISMIKAIIASNQTIIRMEGKQYYEDRTITSQEKVALENVLYAFKALGGTY